LSPPVNWKALAKQEFVLPPLEEQRRMLKQLKHTEAAHEGISLTLTAFKCLEKSFLFNAICDFQLSNTPFIRMDKIGDVQVGRQRAPKYAKGVNPRPYLRVANVFDGFIDTSDILRMDFSDSEFEKFRLVPGDILLNEGQSRELVGRSAIFDNEVLDCCFQNTLIRFRPKHVSSEFAHGVFRGWLYSGAFSSVAKQTTSIAHLGTSRFAAMNMPLPDKLSQEKFVETVEQFNSTEKEISVRKKTAHLLHFQTLSLLASDSC
jgi:type I restriction enzyme S subunit